MATKILLVGKTGQGKSTLGNFLLGRETFKTHVGMCGVSGEATRADGTLCGLPVTIVDMPGLMDAYGAKEDPLKDGEGLRELATKGVKIASECDRGKPGVDVILYVIRADERFSRDHVVIFKFFEDQGSFWDHAIVVFSNARAVGSDERTQRKFLEEQAKQVRCPKALSRLLSKAKEKLIFVEAKDMTKSYRERKTQEFFQQIKTITSKCCDRYVIS